MTRPFIVGFAGPAGAGKTAMATALAPSASIISDTDNKVWTKLSFALPLYRMATARQKIQGQDAFSRQCFEIHVVLTELLRGKLSYDELVDLTYEIVSLPIEDEGKPRTFLQYVGTELLRSIDENVFVRWMLYKVNEDFRTFETEQNRALEMDPDYVPKELCIAIDDVRFPNECDFIKANDGFLVYLDVAPSVAALRLQKRDGVAISVSQKNHLSETSLAGYQAFHVNMDTNNMTLEQQIKEVRSLLFQGHLDFYGSLKS